MADIFFTSTLHPPLGATTVVRRKDGRIRFTACMSVSGTSAAPSDHFTVLLWWSVGGRGPWRPAHFTAADGDIVFGQSGGRRDTFSLELEYAGGGPLQFCLKYRFADGPWQWGGERIGGKDGRLVILPDSGNIVDILDLFPGLDADLDIERVGSDVYYVGSSTRSDLQLGVPAILERFMALVKIASPWIGPLHGGASFESRKDGVMALLQRRDGLVVLVLPVSGAGRVGGRSAYVVSDEGGHGQVLVQGMNDARAGCSEVGVIVAAGLEVQQTVDKGMQYLKHLISDGEARSLEREREVSEKARDFWERGLCYCTWNGLGWNLSERKILETLETADANDIKFCNVLIDDNWQTTAGRNYGSSGSWSGFEANEQFPDGLRGLVKRIREKLPYVEHIGVWHALHGYWDGIAPDSTLARTYKTVECAWRDNVNETEKMLTFIDPVDIERFYDDFFRFLSESGVDSVKTDVQCRIDELKHGADRAMLWQAYQDALRKSGEKYFESRVIYCMSHVPTILFHSLLPDGGPKKAFRTSDDFYPNVPNTHVWHIFANAMNLTLFSRLHILPDWDMFQSSLPVYGSLHAAARCLSGGPLFITDSPGNHNAELLTQMCASSPSGALMALQPHGMARALNPFLGHNDQQLLCMRNYHGVLGAPRSSYFFGIFNVSQTAVIELVPLSDLVEEDGEFLLTAASTGLPKLLSKEEVTSAFLAEDLQPGGWEVWTATPVFEMAGIKLALVGLMGKITGAAALRRMDFHCEASQSVKVSVELSAAGTLGIYYWAQEGKEWSSIAHNMSVGEPGLQSQSGVQGGGIFEVEAVWNEHGQCKVEVTFTTSAS